jgi:hypothetical protein
MCGFVLLGSCISAYISTGKTLFLLHLKSAIKLLSKRGPRVVKVFGIPERIK